MSKRPKDGEEKELTPEQEAARAQYEEHRRQLEAKPTKPVKRRGPPATRDNPFGYKRTPERENIILEWVEKGYSLGFAADKADINRQTLIRWRQEDKEFDARVKDALERGTDLIEDEAFRRATEGIDEPVFQQGGCIGFKRVYSDTLMQMILGGRRSSYGKQRHEHTGADGGPIEHNIEVTFVAPKKEARK